jgi:Predicted Fe-S oxidoreductases
MLFDQLEACGFRSILFTGGEPLAHPRFMQIYENAWQRGFIITIFSNGLLLNNEYKELFLKKRPAYIRISLFGGTAESYKEVTGGDYFTEVINNIIFLHQHKITLKVKMPLLRQNGNDIKNIKQKLESLGISCKIESRIIPRFNGDKEILKFRYTPEEIVGLLTGNRKINMQKLQQISKEPPKKLRTIRYCVEHCQPYVINPDLSLKLCFFIREESVSLREYTLPEAIKYMTRMLETQDDITDESECLKCSRQYMCPYCPGWAKKETGGYNNPIPFLCQLTKLYEEEYSYIQMPSSSELGNGEGEKCQV